MIYDEIIIGSGIAGLYWCYKTKPTNFIILEKSNRIGGRIYNIIWHDQQISLGGGIIKENNSNTIKLVEQLGLELSDSVSKYHMIDNESNNKSNNESNNKSNNESNNESNESKLIKPNENYFYKSNKIITKYLKKLYKKNQTQIEKFKLNWNEFLDMYLDLNTNTVIKSNLLYKTYTHSDIKSVLDDEIDELLRTQDFKTKYIGTLGYTELLDKLIGLIGSVSETNILINHEVKSISLVHDNIYQIKTKSNKIFLAKKIILATESKTNIDFNFSNQIIQTNLYKLYQMVSGSNYIRVYSYHSNTHGLNCSYRTNGMVGKVIYISDKILMCCYTEGIQASELNNLLKKNNKQNQIEIIYNLMLQSNIIITKPDDIIIKFWNTGVHYNKPGYNKEIKKKLLLELKKENIIVVGESIADSHGWVNSALQSVDFFVL